VPGNTACCTTPEDKGFTDEVFPAFWAKIAQNGSLS
jgi:hypothetical protein